MKIETKYDIVSAQNIGAKYDNGVKRLFKSKEIIVPIMEMIIPEFEGCSQQEILNCLDVTSITSEEVVSDAMVTEEEEYQILGDATELSGIKDKLIRYDSKFRIRNPKLSIKNMRVNLHIDLEGQKSYRPKNPSYPIIKRALYYVARDLSSQLGTVVGKTDYSKLEKCYSIWICIEDVPGILQNTMTEYTIKKEDILGETNEPDRDYDLMSVIIIRMGKDTKEQGIFDYLNGLFEGNINKVESYSHIEWEEDFREEVTMSMTGFSDVLVRKTEEKKTMEFIWNMHQLNFTDDIISKVVKQPIEYVQDVLKQDPPL